MAFHLIFKIFSKGGIDSYAYFRMEKLRLGGGECFSQSHLASKFKVIKV